jgi:hypothetical protein
MGNLLTLKNISNYKWYFRSVEIVGSGNYVPEVEVDFPHMRAIHDRFFGNQIEYYNKAGVEGLYVDIRRFVQRHLIGDVLVKNVDMSYSYLYRIEEKYRISKSEDAWRRVKVRHSYTTFHFEEDSDAMLFELKFAGMVSGLEPRHPNLGDVSEEQIKHAEREPWKGNRHYY